MRIIIFTIVWLWISGVALADDQALQPRFQLPEGRYVFTYVLTTSQASGKDSRPPAAQSKKFEAELAVEKAAPDQQVIHVTYRRISDIYGPVVSVTAVIRPNPGLEGTWQNFLNIPFDVTLSPKGDVMNVSGMDRIWKKLLEVDPDAKLSLKDYQNTYGEPFVRDWFKSLYRFMPAKAVQPGDSWKVSEAADIQMLGSVNLEFDVTFRAVDAKSGAPRAILQVSSGSSRTLTPEQLKQLPGQVVKAETKAATSGKVERDLDSGTLRHQLIESTVSGAYVFKAENGQEQTQSQSALIKLEVTLNPGPYVSSTRPENR